MDVLVWCAIGFGGWLLFGLCAGDEKLSPFDAGEFYLLILPMCLLCPIGGYGACLLLPVLKSKS